MMVMSVCLILPWWNFQTYYTSLNCDVLYKPKVLKKTFFSKRKAHRCCIVASGVVETSDKTRRNSDVLHSNM